MFFLSFFCHFIIIISKKFQKKKGKSRRWEFPKPRPLNFFSESALQYCIDLKTAVTKKAVTTTYFREAGPRSAFSTPGCNGSCLSDITSGSNLGCNTDGFSAIAGWDSVGSTRFVASSPSGLLAP